MKNNQTKTKKPCGCKKKLLKEKQVQEVPAKEFYLTDHLQEIAVAIPVSIITAVLMRRVLLVFGFVS